MKNFLYFVIFITCTNCYQPQKLEIHESLNQGMEKSRKLNKPMFLTFYLNCVGSDKLKGDILKNKTVIDVLEKNYVTVILYCDEPRSIMPADTIGFMRHQGLITAFDKAAPGRSIGYLYSIIQTSMFKQNSQPLHVILDSNLNLLNKPFSYCSSAEEFLTKLKDSKQ